ncbi:uncharacterized protein LOC133625785 [Colius striatus]|uniref:uncharacterized protein LOC133625785 n=1 Tax=Colius striatus TaxID=57412 RepID=UPI002B1D33C2|nr:uncharacterized protein LOC133625785 [Colius striatus]
MTYYQSLLLTERIKFAPPAILNPATLMPEARESDQPLHECQEVLTEEVGIRADLTDQPMEGTPSWFTDGSSYLLEGKRKAGAAVVDGKRVVWASSLPEGTSAQKAELVALIQALRLAEGKVINIFTDSRYAFATAHVHGAIYRQRGLLTSAGKEIKNKEEILNLLEAVHLPKKVAIIHCPGHQKGDDWVARGNRMADTTAKEAALEAMILSVKLDDKQTVEGKEETNLSAEEGKAYIDKMHRLTHLGTEKLITLAKKSRYKVQDLRKTVERIVQNCEACAFTNAGHTKGIQGKRLRGDRPGAYWEVDFTEVKPARYGNKYLLVFVDTFSGWVEAYPTRNETALVVAKKDPGRDFSPVRYSQGNRVR